MLIDMSQNATQAIIAELVGVSQQNISALMGDGKLPGYGTVGELLLAYCERLREVAAGRASAQVGGLDLVQERAALARSQREGIEIKNAVLRKEYAPIAQLAEVLATASQAVVERFEQLPSMLRRVCPDLPEAARDQVMTAIASARNEWVAKTASIVTEKVVLADDESEEVVDA